jgi:hypothetical protein
MIIVGELDARPVSEELDHGILYIVRGFTLFAENRAQPLPDIVMDP